MIPSAGSQRRGQCAGPHSVDEARGGRAGGYPSIVVSEHSSRGTHHTMHLLTGSVDFETMREEMCRRYVEKMPPKLWFWIDRHIECMIPTIFVAVRNMFSP